ncbi:hypothetical protein CB1_000715036 [Camelus ferus]|nr:hypothetical protein CB1_000715036 [Camelus ferus]
MSKASLEELLSKQEVQNKCEKLEEEKKKLEEVMNLKRHLEMNTVERSQVQQDKRETEERARQEPLLSYMQIMTEIVVPTVCTLCILIAAVLLMLLLRSLS